jgi:hypothetical protein
MVTAAIIRPTMPQIMKIIKTEYLFMKKLIINLGSLLKK